MKTSRRGNLIYWSHDGGDAWEGPLETGIMGFEPDRITELPDGRLAVTSHLIRGDSQMFAIILSCSDDGGKTWYEEAEIAHDGRQYFLRRSFADSRGWRPRLRDAGQHQ